MGGYTSELTTESSRDLGQQTKKLSITTQRSKGADYQIDAEKIVGASNVDDFERGFIGEDYIQGSVGPTGEDIVEVVPPYSVSAGFPTGSRKNSRSDINVQEIGANGGSSSESGNGAGSGSGGSGSGSGSGAGTGTTGGVPAKQTAGVGGGAMGWLKNNPMKAAAAALGLGGLYWYSQK